MKLNKFHLVGIAFLIAAFVSLLVWIFSKKKVLNLHTSQEEDVRNGTAGTLAIVFTIFAILFIFFGMQAHEFLG